MRSNDANLKFWTFCIFLTLEIFLYSTEFRSAPEVIQYDFTPPERTALVERAKQGLTNLADLAIKLFLRLLKEFRNFKSLEDFKRSVLLPLIEELASVGVQKLIKLIQMAFF